MSLGIITYDFPHLKTEQVLYRLLTKKEIKDITLFALPFSERKKRNVLIPHRPTQTDGISTQDLANNNDLEFIRWDGVRDIKKCDYYLLTGAGILAPDVVRNKKIINCHAGIIPSSRGLDSLKWAIYNGIELGVTLHFLDENIDLGEIISIERTPIYLSDSLSSLARRHYELEINMLSEFLYYLRNPSVFSMPINDACLRMPPEIEAEMVKKFDSYKNNFIRKNGT